MRHKTFLPLVVLSLCLPACTAVDEARLGLGLLVVFGVPLLVIQAVITALGHRARGTAHSIAVGFDGGFSLLVLLGVGLGFDIVFELGRESRSRVLDSFVLVVGIGLVSVAMTAYLAGSATPAPVDTDAERLLENLEFSRRKPGIFGWATGVYSAVAIGALVYFLVA